MVRDTDWSEFFKRYMHDHPAFRDNLRAWIVATNTTVDADAVTLADHETRIDTLESDTGGGASGEYDDGLITEATTLTTDDGTVP